MRTINQVSLQGLWKAYYGACKKHLTGSYEDDEKANIFNRTLKEELTRLQKNGERIDQDAMYRLSADVTRRIYDLGVTDLKDFNLSAIRAVMDGVSIIGAMACVDSSGKSYDFAHMHYMAHLPLSGLTDGEISFLIDAFGGDVDEQWNVLIFMALKVKINSYDYIRNNENKIERMCKNAVCDRINALVLERYEIDLGYASGWRDKVRDYFTLRLM
ncbi:hypothetical protein RYA05_05225 [Pseudomonas syringae pv. actinidiae]|mgnify:CR=1 FL=1|nr:hypothetical protein [Pseudomonas syringae pv. actinidiae]